MGTETTETKETVYDDGSKIVETVTTESEFIEGENSVNVIDPVEVEYVEPEAVTDNEVIIASIEADKEIAIAEIQADARVAEAEAYSEANNEEGKDVWTAINLLQSTVEVLAGEVAKLTAPPLSLEEAAEIVEGSSLTPQSMSDLTNETPTEAIEKSEEENPALEIPPLIEVTGKPIIRLI